MPVTESDWTGLVKTLGYRSEREMLVDMYGTAAMSLSEIAKVLGFSTFAVRRRLMVHGIRLRERGGLHNAGNRKLKSVPDEILFGLTTEEIAAKYDAHKTTVWSERRIRKDGTSSDCTVGADGELDGAEEQAGAYVPCSAGLGELEIFGVDEGEDEGREEGDLGQRGLRGGAGSGEGSGEIGGLSAPEVGGGAGCAE